MTDMTPAGGAGEHAESPDARVEPVALEPRSGEPAPSTGLQRAADLIDAGLPWASVYWPRLGDEPWVNVHTPDREAWLTWIAALSGSVDSAFAATRVEHAGGSYWHWRWITPQADVLVFYLERRETP